MVAISVDSPDASARLRKAEGYSFLILSDNKTQIIRRWDLVHPHAGVDGADIARPAEFLIDSTGKVRWVNLTGDYLVRVRPEEVLGVIDAMKLGG